MAQESMLSADATRNVSPEGQVAKMEGKDPTNVALNLSNTDGNSYVDVAFFTQMFLVLLGSSVLYIAIPDRDIGPDEARAVKQSADYQIDAYVDQQVREHWRPIPGGNSREEAARVSKDILKARSYEELEQVLRYHASQGR